MPIAARGHVARDAPRHIHERTRSVPGGVTTQERGNDRQIIIKGLHQQAQHFWHVAHGRKVVDDQHVQQLEHQEREDR